MGEDEILGTVFPDTAVAPCLYLEDGCSPSSLRRHLFIDVANAKC